jgi:lysyl-tRNA synthetase class 2
MSTDYRQIRIDKLESLRELGENGFAYAFEPTHAIDALLAAFEGLEADGTIVRIAGRTMANRRQGKAGFANLQDRTGRIQLYFKEDILGVERYAIYRKLDVGDVIGIEGRCFVTRSGERSIEVRSIALLAKSLLPLPEKWHGLRDVELRSRQRYVDLIVNEEARTTAIRRARLVTSIRRFLDDRGFIEVETPVLQPVYGGAFATPFTAHYEALDSDVYLRISDELYLKRLIVGGLERVYEIGKDFRNEGMDRTHNPEFTMLELYQAYTDYHGMREICEQMIVHALESVLGTLQTTFEGQQLDFTPPWRTLRYTDALSEKLGRDVLETDREELRRILEERGTTTDPGTSWGGLVDALFGELVEPDLVQPTFVMDYPRELSPLAKVHRADARLVERFEPYVAGMEIGNAFSEQNDPLEQREQFELQGRLREAGDREAQVLDEDYLRALEHGMPPTGGLGVGIDRLAMILAGERNIREVILFPHLRPERDPAAGTDDA